MYFTKILVLAGLTVLGFPYLGKGEDARLPIPAALTMPSAGTDERCAANCASAPERGIDAELEAARAYLLETARPGGTMIRQGPTLAIERLHPEFAKRLAAAVREVRTAGLADAGIFSAYRPPAFGVGGFADKFYSLHAYGLAVDMSGIGAAGSVQARIWHETAARHGIVCPYGYRNRVEWNHCQPTQLEAVRAEHPLRETITGAGPVELARMFEVGNEIIADLETASASVIESRPLSHINLMPNPLNLMPNPRLSMSRRSVRLGNMRRHSFTIREVMANRAGNTIASRETRPLSNTPTLTRGKVIMMMKKPK